MSGVPSTRPARRAVHRSTRQPTARTASFARDPWLLRSGPPAPPVALRSPPPAAPGSSRPPPPAPAPAAAFPVPAPPLPPSTPGASGSPGAGPPPRRLVAGHLVRHTGTPGGSPRLTDVLYSDAAARLLPARQALGSGARSPHASLATCVLRHPDDLRPAPPLGGRSFRGPWLMGARSLRWRPTLPWLAPLLALALLGQSAAPVPGRAAGITFTTAAGPLVGATPRAPTAGGGHRGGHVALAHPRAGASPGVP